ncbi:MAG: SDR family oxidoreductase [Cyanobacteria bacterium P01_F01_bin.33]
MQQLGIIGCGYVGSVVSRLWCQAGASVQVTTTSPERLPELNAIASEAVVLRGDDRSALSEFLRNCQIILLSIGAPNAKAYEATYLNTARTMAAVLPECPNVEQVIFTSSYSLYGDRQGAWVDEDTEISPTTPNAEIMAATERSLLAAATPELKVCILRLGGIYGPGREISKIFSRIAGQTRPGEGREASNWVHLDDIVGAIDFARDRQLGGIYNLVNSNPLTVKQVIDLALSTHDLPLVTWDASQSSTRPYNIKVSNQKLRNAGYIFQHPTIGDCDC